jgi:putative membrane protein
MKSVKSGTGMVALIAALLLAMLPAGAALAGDEDEISPSVKRVADQQVRQLVYYGAAHGHLAVVLGQLAAQRAHSPAVREFGQQVATERADLTNRIYSKAASSNMEAPEALLAGDAQTVATLSTLSGPAFDRAYLEVMILQLESDIRRAEKANRAWNGGWETFAESMLPTLKGELLRAQSLLASLGA